jgi:hypothetical protein
MTLAAPTDIRWVGSRPLRWVGSSVSGMRFGLTSRTRRRTRPRELRERALPEGVKSSELTDSEDIASVAGELADRTRTVNEMESQLEMIRLRAESQQERADIQQDRIDLAVSDRLRAAAKRAAAVDLIASREMPSRLTLGPP